MADRVTPEHVAALDAADPLASLRDAFLIPEGVVYLDGNSLGPLPRATPDRVRTVIESEWGRDLIGSWNRHGWIDLPLRVGAAIAPLVGARGSELVVSDSTSVNVFKLLAGALALRPERSVILSETANFPTDLYMAQGLARLRGNVALRLVERAELAAALDENVAVLLLTHVDFRSGELHDMAALTRAAHDAGALALWDLAHSAGAVTVALDEWDVDLAVGCGYKYLNGGPGAPAFAFVAERLHEALVTPLSGWMGHASPFDFETTYAPAPGIARLLCGTPPILSLAALACGVETLAQAGIERLREKSLALGELFIGLMEQECAGFGFERVTPREPGRRGSQVSFRHAEGYAIVQALIERGVIGDFRAPDILRFGLAPAFLRFADVLVAVRTLREVLERRAWDRPEWRQRARVT